MILALVAAQVLLPNAHAHNDYLHPRPLLDALDQGFCSVEADVFPVDGDLLVAHTRPEIRPSNTLKRLYLDPLAARIRANRGWVHTRGQRFQVLIDFKTEGEICLGTLLRQLRAYPELVGTWAQPGPVSFVISGARPMALLEKLDGFPVSIDGRPSDLGKGVSARAMPLVSDSWWNHFKWTGNDPMPEPEKAKLRALVQQVHGEGKTIRFWASPDRPEVWNELRSAGADWINTDRLADLREFLTSRSASRSGA